MRRKWLSVLIVDEGIIIFRTLDTYTQPPFTFEKNHNHSISHQLTETVTESDTGTPFW